MGEGKMKMKQLRIIPVIICMLFGFLPVNTVPVSADSNIGRVSVSGGDWKYYSSLEALADDVYGYSGKTIVIDMLADWKGERLRIPADSNTTLNMHCHKFDRGLTSDKYGGEVIWIGSDSTVVINGNTLPEKSISSTMSIYIMTGIRVREEMIP